MSKKAEQRPATDAVVSQEKFYLIMQRVKGVRLVVRWGETVGATRNNSFLRERW